MAGKLDGTEEAIELERDLTTSLHLDDASLSIFKGNEQGITERAPPISLAKAVRQVLIQDSGSEGRVSVEQPGSMMDAQYNHSASRNESENREWQFVEDHSRKDMIICIICLDVLVAPHQITCCSEYVCKKCIDSHLQREAVVFKDMEPRCPKCRRTNFRLIENMDLKESIGKLKVFCLYRKSGCMWLGKLEQGETHLQECVFYPIDCPNKCEYGRIERRNLSKHLTECPLQVMECSFKAVGCRTLYPLPRKDVHAHSSKNIHDHLIMLAKSNIRLYEECDVTLASLRSVYSEMLKEKTERICSQKQELSLLEQTAESLEASVLGLTEKINTLKRAEDANRAKCTSQLNAKGEEARGLQDICQATLAEVQALPVPQTTSIYCPPVTFTINNFRSRKLHNEQWLSHPFYTHFGGYKMCLAVHPNGFREAQGSHVSIYLHMMSGEFDDHLQWPFPGAVINVSAISQRKAIVGGVVGSRGNYGGEIVLIGQNSRDARSRVYSGSYGPGYGRQMYVPHCFLNQYLDGDSFKIVIYHFQFLPL